FLLAPPREVILTSDLDRGLDRLGPARDKIGGIEIPRRESSNVRADLGPRLIGQCRMTVGELLGLFGYCFYNPTIAMANVHGNRTARRVDIAVALAVIKVNALGAFEHRRKSMIGEHMAPIAFGCSLNWKCSFWSCHRCLRCRVVVNGQGLIETRDCIPAVPCWPQFQVVDEASDISISK